MTTCVGVDDTSARADEEQARAEAVEHVGERGGFDLGQVNDLADQERTSHVRQDDSKTAAHFIVDEAVVRIALEVIIIQPPTEMKVDEPPHLILRLRGVSPAHIAADAVENSWP